MHQKIAKATPFEGKPIINAPSLYGASTGKGIMYRIPVIGKRPVKISAEGLKEGLSLKNGVITGKVNENSEFTVTIYAENELGKVSKEILFRIAENTMILTPLLGFCSWNAFGAKVTQQDMEKSAKLMDETGIAEYGYNYINLDSGWQKEYGGEFDAIMPNEKFPDMGKMCDYIHSLGFKCGIYSTPMLTAWGCPEELESIPGCTRGEPELWWSSRNGGIGKERCEANNVKQWDKWGFDYLKYDWIPTDPYNAHMMKKELLKAEREFGFCVTVFAHNEYGNYWTKNCTSWRANDDSRSDWKNVYNRMKTVSIWKPLISPGHFYDLDMLEIGSMVWHEELPERLTDDEKLLAYTMRAFFLSPIQISCYIDKLTDFEFDMICNEEIIGINQDSLADYPELVCEYKEAKVYKRKLEDGAFAIAVFNMNDEPLLEEFDFGKEVAVRNVWKKQDVGMLKKIKLDILPHSVAVFKIN